MEKKSTKGKSGDVWVTKSSTETQELGRQFGQRLHLAQGVTLTKAQVVALYGDLGAGKTTFVQGIAVGLGIEKRIISPTFVIVRRYEIPPYSSSEPFDFAQGKLGESRSSSPQGRTIYFYHIDLYRAESVANVEDLGIEEILSDPQNIVVIEWAERLGNLLPDKRWEIQFEYLGEEKRRISNIWKK